METIGGRITKLRKRADMTRIDLGNAVGVSTAMISMWENGKSKPSPDNLFKLAETFGISAYVLWFGETEAPKWEGRPAISGYQRSQVLAMLDRIKEVFLTIVNDEEAISVQVNSLAKNDSRFGNRIRRIRGGWTKIG